MTANNTTATATTAQNGTNASAGPVGRPGGAPQLPDVVPDGVQALLDGIFGAAGDVAGGIGDLVNGLARTIGGGGAEATMHVLEAAPTALDVLQVAM